jgi:hypothetical protein
MSQTDAKDVQDKFSAPHQYQEALQFFSQEQLKTFLNLLDTLQDLLSSNIADYSLDLVHDLLDDETPQIVRTYWFSRGMRDYYLCIDGTGLVRMLDPEMPTRLFNEIFEVLDAFYDES